MGASKASVLYIYIDNKNLIFIYIYIYFKHIYVPKLRSEDLKG